MEVREKKFFGRGSFMGTLVLKSPQDLLHIPSLVNLVQKKTKRTTRSSEKRSAPINALHCSLVYCVAIYSFSIGNSDIVVDLVLEKAPGLDFYFYGREGRFSMKCVTRANR